VFGRRTCAIRMLSFSERMTGSTMVQDEHLLE
jgi:hypothetical protein